jgi:hypothetical protein
MPHSPLLHPLTSRRSLFPSRTRYKMKVLIRSTCRDEEELTKRNGWKLDGRSALALETSSAGSHARGYTWLYDTFITQANEDCDLAFLRKGDINKLSPNLNEETMSALE